MEEALSQFSAIASVSTQVAEHYLEACNWNLETALFQYLENPTDEGAPDELSQQMMVAGDVGAHDIEDIDCNPSPRVSPTGSDHAKGNEDLGEDPDLQRALEASITGDSDLQRALSASMIAQGSGSGPIDVDMESPRLYDTPEGSYPPSRPLDVQHVSPAEPELSVEGHAIRPGQPSVPNAEQSDWKSAWPGSNLPEFPPDVDLEEARMYEAAHFGIPYEGQIPRNAPPRSPSPETIARRVMVSAQNQEYDESLRTDREKAMAAQLAEDEAREMERQKEKEHVAAVRAMEEEQEKLKQLIEAKKSNIPNEPPENAPNTICLIIRLPDGLKLSRRFDVSTPLQFLFDFVDVEVDGNGDLAPGSYNLIRQYPRTVYAPGDVQGSLEAGGFTNNEALFAMKRD